MQSLIERGINAPSFETIEQMALAGDEPDVIVACTGGGSNFAGLVMPYLGPEAEGDVQCADCCGRTGGVSEPDEGAVYV